MRMAPAIAAGILAFSCGAVAGTDYACLKRCVDGGQGSYKCLPQCSFSEAGSARSTEKPLKGRRQFSTPLPGDGVLTRNPAKKAAQADAKDYGCINRCLQEGMQYPLCDARCRK